MEGIGVHHVDDLLTTCEICENIESNRVNKWREKPGTLTSTRKHVQIYKSIGRANFFESKIDDLTFISQPLAAGIFGQSALEMGF